MIDYGAVILAVALYFAINLFLGVYGNRLTQQDDQDYFLGSRSTGTFLLTMTLASTIFSAFTVLGGVGAVYSQGISWWVFFGVLHTTFPFLFWFLGTRTWILGRRFGFITPGELLADYYGSPILKPVTGILGLVMIAPYAAVQLLGGGILLETFTKGVVPYFFGVLAMLLLVFVYTWLGGHRSVVYTDAFQGFLLMAASLFLMVWIVQKVGWTEGWMTLQQADSRLATLNQSPISVPYSQVIIWVVGLYALPHMWQRTLMARSPQVIGQTALALLFVGGWAAVIPTLIIGAFGRALYPSLTASEAEGLAVLMIADYFPGVLGVFILLGIVAAMMSTVDSMLLSASSIITRDIYVGWVNPAAGPEASFRIGKIGVALFTVLLFFLALVRTQGVVVLASYGAGFSVVLFILLLGPLLWPRGTKAGAWTSLVVGTISYWLLSLPQLSGGLIPASPLGWHVTAWTLAIGTVTFVLVSLFTRELPEEQMDRYHHLIHSVLYRETIKTESAYEVHV